MRSFYLTIDLGGTKTSTALFDTKGKMIENYVYTTSSRTKDGEHAVYDNTLDVANQILRKFNVEAKELKGIGVGCPGPLDTKEGVIIHAPLMGWKNFPLKERLENDFNVPVAINNDCALGALAEQRCGLAKEKQNVIYVTVSTGVGSGIVVNGKIYEGRTGGSGEFGHISIAKNGRKCPCGNRGCLELYCSGSGLAITMKRDIKKKTCSEKMLKAIEKGSNPDAKLLSELAQKGDNYSLALFEEMGKNLGLGLTAINNLFEPDMIVLGGSVTKSREFFHKPMVKELMKRTINKIDESYMGYSEMGDRVVLYGAYYLIADIFSKGE